MLFELCERVNLQKIASSSLSTLILVVCTITGKKEIEEFVASNPTVLDGNDFETKYKLIRSKIFNDRTLKRQKVEKTLNKMTMM
jgi:hypothetical protein